MNKRVRNGAYFYKIPIRRILYMHRRTKSKKTKIPKLTEKEYAEYLSALKNSEIVDKPPSAKGEDISSEEEKSKQTTKGAAF